MNKSARIPALLALCMAMFSWGMAPVFIRFLRNAYDPYSQAFIRYFFGAASLAVFCLVLHRKEYLGLLRRPGPLFAMAFLNILHQLTWTLGCYHAPATLAQLFVQLGTVFVIVFSFIIFREERGVIRSPFFLAGTALGLSGVAAVVIGGNRAVVGGTDFITTLLLVIPALCWAVYAVWARHIVQTCHPVPMFAALSVYVTLGTGILALVLGRPACMYEAGVKITLITFVSGLLPIAVAHSSYHFAQKYLGSAFCGSCNLFTPLLTYLMAMIVLDDPALTPLQWSGAAALLSGMGLVTWAGRRESRRHENANY